MTCGIYQILNTLNGKCYVGSSINIENRWGHHKKRLRGNSHHSRKLQRSWNNQEVTIWEWNILQECEEDRLTWLEAFWMAKLDSVGSGYNGTLLVLDGERIHRRHSEETRKKLSEAGKGKIISKETRKKLSTTNTGRKVSEEFRKKMRTINLGRIISEETRKKISVANTGKHPSEETRKKMSDSRKNPSEETRKKMSNSAKNPSEETRKKMREAHLGRKASEETKEKMRKSRLLDYMKKKEIIIKESNCG